MGRIGSKTVGPEPTHRVTVCVVLIDLSLEVFVASTGDDALLFVGIIIDIERQGI